MMHKWHELGSKFNEMTSRERGLITLTVFTAILMLCYIPLDTYWIEHNELTKKTVDIDGENQLALQQIAQYNIRLSLDPNEDYRRRIGNIKNQIRKLDDELFIQNIVPANYMPTLLTTVLSKTKSIKVISFKSLTPQPLLQEKGAEGNQINLYSHGVQLRLQGDYFSILRFLKTVENMPDKLYWESMNYKVMDYPEADVLLEFYTLSVNKDFISVSK